MFNGINLFYLPSNAWISYEEVIHHNGYVPAYTLHQKNQPAHGYTDFELPKHKYESYDFLDFAYQTWGIENIRLREFDSYFAISIKSGKKGFSVSLPTSLNNTIIQSFIVLGEVIQNENDWELINGYRKIQVDLPIDLIQTIQGASNAQSITMNEYIRTALKASVKE